MLENEAEALIALGMLLRRNRPPELQRQVERIVRSELSIERKIDSIRNLDVENRASGGSTAGSGNAPAGDADGTEAARDTGGRRRARFRRPPTPAPSRENREGGNGPLRQPVDGEAASHRQRNGDTATAENRSRLKRPLDRTPLHRFLLAEYARLRRFGKERRILTPRLLPPGVRLQRNAAKTLETEVRPAALQLLEILRPALEDGWLILSKRDYNLLETLRGLCRAVADTDFTSLQLDDPDLIDRLDTVEIPFLVLRSDPEFPSILATSFRALAGNRRTADRRYPGAPALIRRILGDNGTLPSLRDFLLGLNMVKTRRLLDPEELIDPEPGPLIDTGSFHCDPPVSIRIDEHIRKALARLTDLRKQSHEIARVRSFLEPVDREHAGRLLAELYEKYSVARPDGRNFENDRKNAALFVAGFLDAFLTAFDNLLDGEVTTVSGRTGRLFNTSFFGRDLLRLRQLGGRFRHLSYRFPAFSLDRFLAISSSGTGAAGAESEIVLSVQEVTALLREIARRLSIVLARRIRYSPGRQPVLPPVDGMALHGRPFRLPFENARLAGPRFLRGKPVPEALFLAVSLCFGFCMTVRDRPLIALLKRERGTVAEIRGILNLLERIAPQDLYLRVKDGTVPPSG